ncbi:hypothetical protein GCM10009677_63420 [Sphaerisporangium rubeum]|uniref:Thioredoxin domain-containing protein n=1 Tax=Sphaerisporangium rubeum TaxID=321317 RepID=A0A7X0IAJ2_9ACTN|nr:hypothetical protein [Sphaerisporangium rubeum]MBB6471631.1 hypothetical protein [Sphaerisporangium rubeum]
MQNVVNSLAVFAFLGMVIALFAISALLRTVRELRQAVLATPVPATPAVRRIARFQSPDERPTYVLVVTEQCLSCRERAAHLAVIPPGLLQGHLTLLGSTDAGARWVHGADHITVVADAELLGAVAVGATPSLVKYAADGTEEWRRVVGSDGDLERLLGVTESSNVPNVR